MWYGNNEGKMRNAELATAIASKKMSTDGWIDRADTTRTRRNLQQNFPNKGTFNQSSKDTLINQHYSPNPRAV